MAKVCCSIETEPRTLREGQLIHAREVAAGVIHDMEPKEASHVFTNGLKGVRSSKGVVENEEENEEEEGGKLVKGKSMVGIPCQCSRGTSSAMESPEELQLKKEPVTAPF